MTKTLLIALMLLCGIVVSAQQERLYIGTNQLFYETDTMRTFSVFGIDNDVCKNQISDHLGKPASNTAGTITWKNVTINDLGKGLTVTIKDGIHTSDRKNKSACWVLFTSEEDKQKKMAALDEDTQVRKMQIEITDAQGNNIVNSNKEEEISKTFLASIFKS